MRAAQFFELKAKHVNALFPFGHALAQFGELLRRLPPRGIRLPIFRQQRPNLVRGVFIQIADVVFAVQQQLVLMLAVNIQ